MNKLHNIEKKKQEIEAITRLKLKRNKWINNGLLKLKNWQMVPQVNDINRNNPKNNVKNRKAINRAEWNR